MVTPYTKMIYPDKSYTLKPYGNNSNKLNGMQFFL
jgi:hypothetical protein